MRRTIISLEPECREWLVEQASHEHVSQAEVVRRALRLYREKMEYCVSHSFEKLAWQTSGLQQGEDGMALQQRLRGEWRSPLHEARYVKE